MDDKSPSKVLFSVVAETIISDTDDETIGEATVGYKYKLDCNMPELVFAMAGFLRAIDDDEDLQRELTGDRTVGEAFINLLNLYYTHGERQEGPKNEQS